MLNARFVLKTVNVVVSAVLRHSAAIPRCLCGVFRLIPNHNITMVEDTEVNAWPNPIFHMMYLEFTLWLKEQCTIFTHEG